MLAKFKLWQLYLVIIFPLFGASLLVPADAPFDVGPTVLDPAKATLDIIDGVIKLVMALNTVMVGGAAALTVKGTSWTFNWTKLDSLMIVLVFLSGGVAYFGVYFCYMRLLTMVNQVTVSSVNVGDIGVILALRLQYSGIIIGFACLGLVFSRVVEGRISTASAR